jgi:hypothetical protein
MPVPKLRVPHRCCRGLAPLPTLEGYGNRDEAIPQTADARTRARVRPVVQSHPPGPRNSTRALFSYALSPSAGGAERRINGVLGSWHSSAVQGTGLQPTDGPTWGLKLGPLVPLIPLGKIVRRQESRVGLAR